MFRPHHTPQNLMHIIPSVLNIFLPQTDMFSEFSFYPVDIPSAAAAAAAKSLQSCPTLCNPVDGSPPGSLVPGILQARTLEWVAFSFSKAWKWKVKVKSLSRVRLLACTAAYQAPPSMGFSRQEYWSGVPLPSPTPRSRALDNVLGSEWGGVYSTNGRNNEM